MPWPIHSFIENFIYTRFFAKLVDVTGIGPIVTFTFDDFPCSALFNGGRMLEKYGVKGTFYLAPGLCGKTTEVGKIVSRENVIKCTEAGHEVGNHTYSHLDCCKAGKNEIIADIKKANEDMQNIKMENFSFPFGECGTKSKLVLRSQFKSCRGIQSGINQGLTDMLELKSNAIYTKNKNLDSLQQKISNVKSNGGWLIFYTHDVSQIPSPYGCTEADLERLINTAIENDVPIKSVAEAVADLR